MTRLDVDVSSPNGLVAKRLLDPLQNLRQRLLS